MVEGKAHVHERLGRSEVIRVRALEQHDGEVLHQAVERGLAHAQVVDPLRVDEAREPETSRLRLERPERDGADEAKIVAILWVSKTLLQSSRLL